ncbi:hypothetical protein [Thalassotalea sp. Y01]|uniref:hypothetical protein n=1 Tax=Thalassotalea sp. Y01 TaxID=2729613 RepID=UPI00145D1959|nr:hypothetical protein [Thalassotalea sp. Y01]NMP16675.1 hypothetical protein [Thalassotalea sp. Y01]
MEFLEGLYALIKIILFSSQTVVNNSPIEINDNPIEIKPAEEISVLNHRVQIQIKVTHIVGSYDNVVEQIDKVKEKFPKGCLLAKVHTKDDGTFTLDETGADSSGNVIFHTFQKVPVDAEVDKIEVSSCYPIHTATLIWKNGGM